MVTSVALTTATPPDLAGVLAIGVLSVVCGGRVDVEPQAGWREGTNLFVAAVMEPGERKSAVLSLMKGPLDQLERQLQQQTHGTRLDAAQRRRVAERQRDRAEAAAAAAAPDDMIEMMQAAADASRALSQIDVPPEPRLYTDDVTPEALAGLLVEHGGRMALLSADPSLFAIAAGRYSRGVPVLEIYLKGHANDTLRVDRRGRPAEVVDRPALTVAVTVQPAVMRLAGENGQFRGRGLLDRFLYAVPTSMVGHRPVKTPALPPTVVARYEDGLLARARILDGMRATLTLGFTPEATDRLDQWRVDLERQQRQGGDLAGLSAWASKLGGATVRLAGLHHVGGQDETGIGHLIGVASVEAAIQLSAYFASHALVAFDLMGEDEALALARRIEAWIIQHKRPSFSRRDVLREVRPRPNVKAAAAALSLMEAYGHVATEESARMMGRPSLRFAVNPSVLGQSGQ